MTWLEKLPWLGCIGLTATFAIFSSCQGRAHQSELADLRNKLAESAKTAEISKGLYEKAAVELHDLKSLLDSKDERIKALLAQVSSRDEQIVVANQLIVRWKHAYEDAVNATQPPSSQPVPPGCEVVRTRVEFAKDLGPLRVGGWTITNPPEGHVKIEQVKPLVLTVAVTQAPDKSWHVYAAPDDDNISVDIALAGVNPYVFDRKWYERLGAQLFIGAGGVTVAGFGVTYEVSNWSIGPVIGIGLMGGQAEKFYGISATWRPFDKR